MNQAQPNFTPLPQVLSDSLPQKKGSLLSALFMNLIALTAGLALVGLVAVQRNIARQSRITNTKAEEPVNMCPPNQNPASVQATITKNKKEEPVDNGASLTTKAIKFTWKPIAGAKSYYVYLATASGIFDAAKSGTQTDKTEYVEVNLKPSSSYFLLIRTLFKDGRVGSYYPTPGNCLYALPSQSIFNFTILP